MWERGDWGIVMGIHNIFFSWYSLSRLPWPHGEVVNATVCKTVIRGFDPHCGLHPTLLLTELRWGLRYNQEKTPDERSGVFFKSPPSSVRSDGGIICLLLKNRVFYSHVYRLGTAARCACKEKRSCKLQEVFAHICIKSESIFGYFRTSRRLFARYSRYYS